MRKRLQAAGMQSSQRMAPLAKTGSKGWLGLCKVGMACCNLPCTFISRLVQKTSAVLYH